ncbi:hypothetical protein KHA96_12015 [Bacillus sp. FJAT-49711]|uniref:DNA sulfur modification protein DndB n=1 Tax=Bacillus sp. FJAT-49711 TaxID=2833585 RepID=UPI001BC9A560|nr:DNA sulfur modification protein DndB [Bacillus sp. FJAT-49711]MBS4219042.1 hypothetical protein [Bacillus sp. FJAT-49711]
MTKLFIQKHQLITSYTIEKLEKLYTEDKLKLREINKLQVRQIRRYILENAYDERIYFPPIVAHRNVGDSSDTLFIIDGTQRIRAFTQLYGISLKSINSDDEIEVKNAAKLLEMLSKTEVAVQIFEGMSEKEADQMYVDFNTKGKKVALSKRIAFDSRDEINIITNGVLQNNTMLRLAGVEMEKRAVVRPANKNFLSLSQLRQIIGLFLTGRIYDGHKMNTGDLSLHIDQYLDLVHTWFKELFELYPVASIGDYEESMLASFPLLTAVALYALTNTDKLSYEERKSTIISRMKRLNGVDWSRGNPVWTSFEGTRRGAYKYFYLNKNKRNIERLAEWLQTQGR